MQTLKEQVASEKPVCPPTAVLVDEGLPRTVHDMETVEPLGERRYIPVLLPHAGTSTAVRAYCAEMSALLGGQMVEVATAPRAFERQFKRAAREHDFLLVGLPKQPTLERLVFGRTGQRAVCRSSTTVLVVQAPRWPIQKVLLVLRVQPQEASAVDWAGSMIQLTGADLTIQPVIPQQPLMYGPGSLLHITIDSLLTPGTPCGEQLRSFLDQLKEWQVQGTLRVRQGDPVWQVCTEIDSADHDLIIIGAEPQRRLPRWFTCEIVEELVNMVKKPLLIVSARQGASRHARHRWPLMEVPHER